MYGQRKYVFIQALRKKKEVLCDIRYMLGMCRGGFLKQGLCLVLT